MPNRKHGFGKSCAWRLAYAARAVELWTRLRASPSEFEPQLAGKKKQTKRLGAYRHSTFGTVLPVSAMQANGCPHRIPQRVPFFGAGTSHFLPAKRGT